MRKEIRRVDTERGILQVTTTGERWYSRATPDDVTGMDRIESRPSVSWIVSYYPKGPGYEAFLKSNGDDAEVIKQLAGLHGYKEHQAIEILNKGKILGDGTTFKMQDKVLNPTTREMEELDTEEYAGVCSYVDWWETDGKLKYIMLASEFTTWPDAQRLAAKTGLNAGCFAFAGTVDLKVKRIADGKVGIIDVKRSKSVYPAHELQVSAYRESEEADWAAILQINYKLPKTRRWKFTEVEDKFSLFRATMAVWQNENGNVAPLQRDFPLELKLS